MPTRELARARTADALREGPARRPRDQRARDPAFVTVLGVLVPCRNEAAVLGLTGIVVPPLAKGAGVLITGDGDVYRVEPAS